jgi:uridine phosphorylase
LEFHIKANAQDISRYCFTPGDHVRARKIASHFENARLVDESRGYLIFSGDYQGVFMTVCATGMGGPAVAIAVEELAHLGANTFMRIGSCGGMQPFMQPGDVVIATGAVRLGGTANAYLPMNYPAVPTFDVTRAIADAANDLNVPSRLGLAASSDAFYAPNENRALITQANVLAIEMESDTLFILGQYRGWRTGALFSTDGTVGEIKPPWGEEAFRRGEENVIQIGLQAMHKIAMMDSRKRI